MPVPDSITKLIEGSGNTFHARVARWFTDHGWTVLVSPYYMDHTQSRSRELDLIVEKSWPVPPDHYGRPTADRVLVRLFVECKYMAADTVLWFAPKDAKATTQLLERLGFPANNIHTKEHHYLTKSPRVAKLFASAKTSPENDPIYKALNQALNGTVAMRSSTPGLITSNAVRCLSYPVVVCSSFAQMYAADFLAEAEPSIVKDNFQMEVQYAYLQGDGREYSEYFLLDFVEFGKLEDFEKDLAVDAGKAAFFASRN